MMSNRYKETLFDKRIKSITVQVLDGDIEKTLHLRRIKSSKLSNRYVLDGVTKEIPKSRSSVVVKIIGNGSHNELYRIRKLPIKMPIILQGTGPGSPIKMKGELIAVNDETIRNKR